MLAWFAYDASKIELRLTPVSLGWQKGVEMDGGWWMVEGGRRRQIGGQGAEVGGRRVAGRFRWPSRISIPFPSMMSLPHLDPFPYP